MRDYDFRKRMIGKGYYDTLSEENMKEGQFCSVHFEDGCRIGRIVSCNGDTITVEFDNGTMEGIPKEIVMPFNY